MVAARLGYDALCHLFFCQGEDGIRGSADFERAGLLQVLALEEELRPGYGVQGCGCQDWRSVNSRGNTRVGREDRFPTRRLVDGRFSGWGSAHLAHFGLGDALLSLTITVLFVIRRSRLLKRHYGMLIPRVSAVLPEPVLVRFGHGKFDT